jgi:hypothetical protein
LHRLNVAVLKLSFWEREGGERRGDSLAAMRGNQAVVVWEGTNHLRFVRCDDLRIDVRGIRRRDFRRALLFDVDQLAVLGTDGMPDQCEVRNAKELRNQEQRRQGNHQRASARTGGLLKSMNS